MKEQDMKREKSTLVKPHNEVLSYLVEVTDKEGHVIKRIEAPSKSFVRQWNQVVNIQAKQLASTLTDTGGVGRSISVVSVNLLIQAGAGVTNYGIRVGKGSTAVTINDYALETPLAEGAGADQLNHVAGTYTGVAINGSDASFNIKRSMINNSGSTISGINEIGAYMRMGSYYGLAFRDVLGGAVSVPDGGAITITYTIKVSA